MSELVPTGPRDLIFQPTETLSARVVSAVEEKADAEEKLKEAMASLDKERRSKNGANLRSMLFFGMALAAAAGAFFIWSGTESQIATAMNDRDAAFEARDAAEAEAALQQQVVQEQLVQIEAFDEYRNVVDTTFEIRRLQEELVAYDNEFKARPSPNLNKATTLEVRSTELNWLGDKHAELKADEARLRLALEDFNTWVRVRVETPPRRVCLPTNPLRPRPPQPGCVS